MATICRIGIEDSHAVPGFPRCTSATHSCPAAWSSRPGPLSALVATSSAPLRSRPQAVCSGGCDWSSTLGEKESRRRPRRPHLWPWERTFVDVNHLGRTCPYAWGGATGRRGPSDHFGRHAGNGRSRRPDLCRPRRSHARPGHLHGFSGPGPARLRCPEIPTIAVEDVQIAFAAVVCHFRPQRTPHRLG